MSDYADGAPAIAAFLGHMQTAPLTPRRVDCLVVLDRYLGDWAKNNTLIFETERRSLHALVTEVLLRPDHRRVVADLLASDEISDVTFGLSLADRFGIDGRPVAREWLDRRPYQGYLWQWLLAHAVGEQFEALVADAARLLPLDELASGPEDNLGLGLTYQADSALRTVIQSLRCAPGLGWPLVDAALRNRVTGVRNGALRILDEWPTERWPSAAREVLTAARDIEPRADTRDMMRALLDTGRLPPRPGR